jgi:hypothetical protein
MIYSGKNLLNLLIFEMREHLNIYECHLLSEVALIEHQDLAAGVARATNQLGLCKLKSKKAFILYIFALYISLLKSIPNSGRPHCAAVPK